MMQPGAPSSAVYRCVKEENDEKGYYFLSRVVRSAVIILDGKNAVLWKKGYVFTILLQRCKMGKGMDRGLLGRNVLGQSDPEQLFCQRLKGELTG